MCIPTTRRALTIEGPSLASVQELPMPSLRPDTILVRTSAIALNPTDWKSLKNRAVPGAISGCDYAGTVIAISESPTHDFKVGDRVAGMTYGCNPFDQQTGAFSDYVLAKTGIALKVPEGMSWAEAATLGVGVTTVGQGLYQSLGLPWPGQGGKGSVLVYGGSTATGTLAVQMAKLSGLDVITTCSPRNFDLLKSLGATAVFDYSSPTVGADINAYTSNKLLYAFDCISEGSSPSICAAALSTAPPAGVTPKYSTLLVVPKEAWPRDDVTPTVTLGYSAFGEKYVYAGETKEKPEDYVWAAKWWSAVQGLLERDEVKVHRPEVRNGGLEGVLGGLGDLERGVSGVKLVYEV